jgi:hypothetical protein
MGKGALSRGGTLGPESGNERPTRKPPVELFVCYCCCCVSVCKGMCVCRGRVCVRALYGEMVVGTDACRVVVLLYIQSVEQ